MKISRPMLASIPVVLVVAWHVYVLSRTSFEPWVIALGFLAFLVAPMSAGFLYGRVTAKLPPPQDFEPRLKASRDELLKTARRLRGELGVCADLLNDAGQVIGTLDGDDDAETYRLRSLGERIERTVIHVRRGA